MTKPTAIQVAARCYNAMSDMMTADEFNEDNLPGCSEYARLCVADIRHLTNWMRELYGEDELNRRNGE